MASIRRTAIVAAAAAHHLHPRDLTSSSSPRFSKPHRHPFHRRLLLFCRLPRSPDDLRLFLCRLLLCLAIGVTIGIINAGDHADLPAATPPPTTNTRFLLRRQVADDEAARKPIDEGDVPPPAPKLLIVVTPTYNRAFQGYYLTRLAHTLRLVPPPLLWIVVEMGLVSTETADLLRGAGVMYRHIACNRSSGEIKDRGVHQRNAGLQHIERHKLDGIVYFADDDNIYSRELFHHIREIRRFGTWPVAMLTQGKSKAILEGPVCNGNQVIGWHTNEKSRRFRRFHVDMSGFAFNSTILWDHKRWHRPTSKSIRQIDTVKEGFQETTFIEQLVEDESQMEPVPLGCPQIMNWHLHVEAKNIVYPRGWQVPSYLDGVIPISIIPS